MEKNSKSERGSYLARTLAIALVLFTVVHMLLATGVFVPSETYIQSLIYQMGHNPKALLKKKNAKYTQRVYLAKKDQTTTHLIRKDPKREDFASIIEFLSSKHEVKRPFAPRSRNYEIFRLDFGYFPNIKNFLPIRTSFTEWAYGNHSIPEDLLQEAKNTSSKDKLTELLASTDYRSEASKIYSQQFSAQPSSRGITSIVRLEEYIFPPRGKNIFKVLAGVSEDPMMPFLLFGKRDKAFWDNFENDYAEALAEPTFRQDKLYENPYKLFYVWENIFANLLTSTFSLEVKFFPTIEKPCGYDEPDSEQKSFVSISLKLHTKGLAPTYTVEPASAVAVDFVLTGRLRPETDERLAAVLENSSIPIVLAEFLRKEESASQLPMDIPEAPRIHEEGEKGIVTIKQELRESAQTVYVTAKPDPMFTEGSNISRALINIKVSSNGLVDSMPLFGYDHGEDVLKPSFALLTAVLAKDRIDATGGTYEQAMYEELAKHKDNVKNGIYPKRLVINDIDLPLDNNGGLQIYYLGTTVSDKNGNPPAFMSYSFYELYEENLANKYLNLYPESSLLKPDTQNAHRRSLGISSGNKAGKIIMMGTMKLTDMDFYHTPFTYSTPFTKQSEKMAGIEIQANAVANILDGLYLKPADLRMSAAVLLGAGLFLAVLLSYCPPVYAVFPMFAAIAAVFYSSYYSFHHLHQPLHIAHILVAMLAVWAATLIRHYVWQRRKTASVKNMFSKFVSADVVKYMVEHPDLVKPGGEKAELTIFFSDLAGFTTISEKMQPEALVELLNEYLAAMTDILFKYGGTLDKFIGDAVMAFWNYPKQDENHALHACLCALEMQEKIRELQIGWKDRGLPILSARAGLNTAEVAVGYMGSERSQMNFTCIGDGVNLASRMEGANKEYGTQLMISEALLKRVKDDRLTVRFLDLLTLKGKAKPVKVYELICRAEACTTALKEKIEKYEKAHKLHLERKFDEAIELFEEILKEHPEDGPSKTYLERCKHYKDNPPNEDWDGRFIMTTK
ncbi:MAG: CHASE2 domain-containing protein [Candidatus Riflebacteria bacterium]|nr:CHASE2 domain-containing protein [Candidatus Riflebacteria bacterium]